MAQRFGDEIWGLVFQELQTLYSEPPKDDMDLDEASMVDEEQTGDEDKDPWEEERTWRDPSSHKLRGIVTKWLSSQNAMKELVKVRQTS